MRKESIFLAVMLAWMIMNPSTVEHQQMDSHLIETSRLIFISSILGATANDLSERIFHVSDPAGAVKMIRDTKAAQYGRHAANAEIHGSLRSKQPVRIDFESIILYTERCKSHPLHTTFALHRLGDSLSESVNEPFFAPGAGAMLTAGHPHLWMEPWTAFSAPRTQTTKCGTQP